MVDIDGTLGAEAANRGGATVSNVGSVIPSPATSGREAWAAARTGAGRESASV
jgi:hypothetical protein